MEFRKEKTLEFTEAYGLTFINTFCKNKYEHVVTYISERNNDLFFYKFYFIILFLHHAYAQTR